MNYRHLFPHIITYFLVFLVIPLSTNLAYADDEPPQVLMIGVFHFSNPGLDMIKTDQINVMRTRRKPILRR